MVSRVCKAWGRHWNAGIPGILAWCLALGCRAGASASEAPFGFDRLRQEAQRLAAEPYRPVDANLPPAWRDLNYDGYRAITFRSDKALWRGEGLPFRVEFYHRGYLFRQPIKVSVVDGGAVKPVSFSPDWFDYGASPAREHQPSGDFGFAGFRLTHPINGPVDHEEFISFLGATYFRAVGRHQVYGVSARGLAIGMGSPHEEFPLFREFWIEKPERDAQAIVVYALLDSPSVAGAYRFDIRPGDATVVAVRAELFPRRKLTNLGIAPLTSMYLYGPSGPERLRGARPQVHDSDGLLIAGESNPWIWRPLANPDSVSVSDVPAESIRGFGLMQRDRDPEHYKDPRTSYERRPSLWVEVPDPSSLGEAHPWRRGSVRLLELPSDGEGQDNIGACWTPADAVEPQQGLPIRYQLHFGPDAPQSGIGKVAATRWAEQSGGKTRFEVDFDLPATVHPKATVFATPGEVGPAQVSRDPSGKYWRIVFEAEPPAGRAAELRAFLHADGRPLTETWSFAWPR